MTVAPRTVPIYRSFPAATEPLWSIAIQALVTGYLIERGAADGADVQPGVLLAPQTAVGASQIGRTLMVVGEGGKAEQRMVSWVTPTATWSLSRTG